MKQLPPTTSLTLPVFCFVKGETTPFLTIGLNVTDIGLRNSTLSDIAKILESGTYSREATDWVRFIQARRWITHIYSSKLVLPDHYIKITEEGAEEVKPS